MTELDDAMTEHMAYIVFQEHRPFSYRDFLHFEVDEREYKIKHGTFRNKISSLMRKGEVELSYVSGSAFYTFKNVKFGRPQLMTGTHLGGRHSHPIVKLIQDLPVEKNALHDIHLRFEIKGLWSLLSASPVYKPSSHSKDICLLPLKAGGIIIRTTIHSTDTVSVVAEAAKVKEESNEPNYDQDQDQLENEQEGKVGEIAIRKSSTSTNQVF